MPRLPRKYIFDESEPGIYHCINRCVRRAFLCGTDPVTGQCFEHRKVALQERLAYLAGQLGIDILGFAVMSNHIHVVARNRPDLVATWSNEEVARRWWNIFPQRKTPDGKPAEPHDSDLLMITLNPERLAEIRRRLSSIPWFMRCLVEPIARQANREDECTGRFWQGRYRLQKILDDSALAACLVYVDLNPIRAGVCDTPEESVHTSVYERLEALNAPLQPIAPSYETALVATDDAEGSPQIAEPESPKTVAAITKNAPETAVSRDAWLSPFELTVTPSNEPVPPARASNLGCLPMSFAEYLQLLDWTGRQYRQDKRGVIPSGLAPILDRLSLDSDRWLKLLRDFRRQFSRAAGRPESMTKEAQKHGGGRMPGINHSRAVFGAGAAGTGTAPPQSSA